ncbi:MAG: LysM peptidoglycan-binding domain-containing protein [Elusimicrobiota bacterium]|nr:LysM peptidoglycan-binding domain-containing protein [Elusimicrobiota bacterium]
MKLLAAVAVCACLAAPVRAADAGPLQDVVVRPGDTLWSIANRYLDDPSRWDEILAHNRLPSKDPTIALPGMTLRVPTRLIKAAMRAAHLTYFVNEVRWRRSETAGWKGVSVGMELRRGDGLRTHADSRARVMLLDKELLNLEADSMAIIKPDEASDLVLRRGGVFAGKARIVTASARVTPRSGDTRYFASVEPDLTTRVQVMRGTATVDAQGASVEVPAGMETAVPPGMKPGPLRPVRDLPLLEARAQEHLSALKAGGGIAADPRPEPPAPEPEGDVESVRGDIQVLKIGQPIKAYHVQASATVDFRKPLFDRFYDEGERFVPSDTGLAPGNYWWRVAAVDLLGVEGAFKPAHYYSLGLKQADPDEERMASALSILTPENNDQIGGEVARASGILRDQRLTLHINGVPVKVNEDGTFAITVRVRYGRTAIVFSLTDPKGNQAHVSRYVMKL